MLDINLLRKDLPSAIARLETRKTPQTFLNVEAFQALEAERKAGIWTESVSARRAAQPLKESGLNTEHEE